MMYELVCSLRLKERFLKPIFFFRVPFLNILQVINDLGTCTSVRSPLASGGMHAFPTTYVPATGSAWKVFTYKIVVASIVCILDSSRVYAYYA